MVLAFPARIPSGDLERLAEGVEGLVTADKALYRIVQREGDSSF